MQQDSFRPGDLVCVDVDPPKLVLVIDVTDVKGCYVVYATEPAELTNCTLFPDDDKLLSRPP